MLKSINQFKGIKRYIDELGRLSVSREIYYNLDIDINSKLDIYLNNGKIYIKKFDIHNIRGIVRHLDCVWRIVIPREYLNILKIKLGKGAVDIYREDNIICIESAEKDDECIFCQSTQNIAYFKNVPVCKSCILEAFKNTKF
jgi:transcriptional pleiotropic regulator of transition state genes